MPVVPTRRHFIEGAGAVAGTLAAAAALAPAEAEAARQRPMLPRPPKPVGSPASAFRDRYRKHWTWDEAHRGTHNLNCWYQQNCCFHVFTKNGAVLREEQVGDYPQTHPGVPDFNPRGCQKGCAYSSLMYSEPRVLTPLRRAGERGSGAWTEVSWDTALSEIADKVIDILTQDGPDTLVLDPGGNIVSQIALFSIARLFDLLDGVYLDVNCELGDDQQGAAVTYGEPAADRSADDYFYSDLIFIWGGNPAFTQIPNFHFLTEARYNGTRIVAISPDMNASALHADLWIPVRPGTDAALALSMAKVVLDENLYDAELLREQTDMPFLVVEETGKLLTEFDIDGGGKDVLYRWDQKRNRLAEANLDTLALGRVVPALEGRFSVRTDAGRTLVVRPVFELLKDRLRDYDPERASGLCGVAPETIRMLARMLAGAKAATNTCTSGLSKYFHGDLLMRAQILVFVLCGHLGGKGAGYVTSSFLLPDGVDDPLRRFEKYKELKYTMGLSRGWKWWWEQVHGMSPNMAAYGYLSDVFVPSRLMTNSTLFWNLHGGLLDRSDGARAWVPDQPRAVGSYLDEAMRRKWQVLEPAPPREPRALFVWMGNPLRRVRRADRLLDVLWPKLKLVVVADLRISSTALHADYVLPISGSYEKTTTMAMNTGPLAPFLHTTAKAVDNVGDSKDEWEVVCLLAKKIQERAIERGIVHFVGRRGNKRTLDDIFEALTEGGRLGEKDGEDLSRRLVNQSTNLGGVGWERLKEHGYTRFTGLGNYVANAGNACDIDRHETISPHTWHRTKKAPWATRSRRVQFYIDHDWYLELGEALPVHKDPPKAGGDYPITLTGGHARWSIHSTFRSDPTMLRLQRGEPCLWMSAEDAAARGIRDGDRVRVSNDVGAFVTRATVSPAIMPGQAVMYHGWENYQFEGGMGYRNVLASPLNPIEMVGDYPFMKPLTGIRQPGQSDRDTRVEVRQVDPRPRGELP